jgi:predicted Rossmann fold flavoprotein
MKKYSIAVIGGGPAGICAAISARRLGQEVVICEKLPHLGKKILATGNGRCNLANDKLDASHYNPHAGELVRSVFGKFGKTEILEFFEGLGLKLYSKDGRFFPVTNQASSVVKALDMELRRLAVPAMLEFDCNSISFSKGGPVVHAKDGRSVECQRVVVAGGGMAAPALGSDGSLYAVARALGHIIIPPVPAAVPLLVNDRLCRLLQGQRISACARSVIEGQPGREARGELLFTKYGLSGTCILDISGSISVALDRERRTDVQVSLDLLPFMAGDRLREELAKRLGAGLPYDEVLVGLLPNKLAAALQDVFNKKDPVAAACLLKDKRFKISGTRGWSEAEYTSGGVDIREIEPETLESRIKKNVYFAGEILDVDGERGGYNLAWAWASGFLAGHLAGWGLSNPPGGSA